MSIIQDYILYGDAAGSLGGHVRAGSENLQYFQSSEPVATFTGYGDAATLSGDAVGGDDTLLVSAIVNGVAYGDAQLITGHARGGNDTVTGAGQSTGVAYGDADTISGFGRGGNDTVSTSASYGSTHTYGDARLLTDHAHGGDDTLTSYASVYHGTAYMYGDADTMSGYAVGGNDTLTANAKAIMYGDAAVLKDHAKGGNDTLKAAGGAPFGNTLYGDGQQLLDHAQGGNDVLISDSNFAADQMWGDAAVVGPHATTGADRFVIMQDSGHDQIMDFQPGKDHIDLSDYGFTQFSQVAAIMHASGDGVLISFDAQSDVLVHGVGHLAAGDFLLA